MYFSTFEPINLTPGIVMQLAGVPMPLYYSASSRRLPLPSGKRCGNAGGDKLKRGIRGDKRPGISGAPLIPCFVGGNIHPDVALVARLRDGAAGRHPPHRDSESIIAAGRPRRHKYHVG